MNHVFSPPLMYTVRFRGVMISGVGRLSRATIMAGGWYVSPLRSIVMHKLLLTTIELVK